MNAPNHPLSAERRNAERKAYEPSMEEILASIRRIIADDQAFVQSGLTPAPVAPQVYQEPPRFRTEPQPPSFPPPSNFAPPGNYAPPPNRETPPARTAYAPPPPSYEDYLAQTRPAPVAPQVPPPPAATPVHYPIDGQFQSFKTATYAPEPDPAPFSMQRDLPPPPMAAAEPFAPRPVEPRVAEPRVAEQRPAQASAPTARPAEGPRLVSPQTDAAVSSAFGALIASQALPSDEEITGMVREMLRPMLKSWLDDNLPVLVERLVRMEIERVARGR